MEKNFFMIWIGDSVPKYAEHSFNAFKDTNPQFACDFVHFGMNDPGAWKPRLENYKVRGCAEFSKCMEQDDAWHRCMLATLLKYYLIQVNGGIFADCDMFPIKSFNELAILDRPFKVTKTKPPEKFVSDDINFMGCPKGMNAQGNPLLLFPIKLYDFDDPEYTRMRDRFFSCSIQLGEHYNNPEMCYVDHYDSNTYGRNKRNLDIKLS